MVLRRFPSWSSSKAAAFPRQVQGPMVPLFVALLLLSWRHDGRLVSAQVVEPGPTTNAPSSRPSVAATLDPTVTAPTIPPPLNEPPSLPVTYGPTLPPVIISATKPPTSDQAQVTIAQVTVAPFSQPSTIASGAIPSPAPTLILLQPVSPSPTTALATNAPAPSISLVQPSTSTPAILVEQTTVAPFIGTSSPPASSPISITASPTVPALPTVPTAVAPSWLSVPTVPTVPSTAVPTALGTQPVMPQTLVPTLVGVPSTSSPAAPSTSMPTSDPLFGTSAPSRVPSTGAPNAEASDIPSDTPSLTPSFIAPTTPSTPVPTVVSTGDSTAGDSGVYGEIVVILFNVVDEMSPNNQIEFENDMAQFFTENPPDPNATYFNWTVSLSKQSTLKTRQRQLRLGENRRNLQQNSSTPLIDLVPLETRSFVTAEGDVIEDIDAFNDRLRETMNRNSTGFTLLLREADTILNQVYFRRVENVEAVPVEPEVTSVPSATAWPTSSPAPTRTFQPTTTMPPVAPQDEGLSAGAMAGIVLGSVVALLIFFTFVTWCIKKRMSSSSSADVATTAAAATTEDLEGAKTATATAAALAIPASQRTSRKNGNPAVGQPSQSVFDAALSEGLVPAASQDSRTAAPDDETQLGSRSLLSVQDTRDEMSYAFSLDPGGVGSGSTAGASAGSPGLAAKGSLGDFRSEGETTAHVRRTVNREVMAPPGKLGLVLDTIEGKGPVVHKVNPNSPLEGSIFEGDVITSINGVDTRQMTAEDITGIMVQTSKGQRNLTVQSDYYQ